MDPDANLKEQLQLAAALVEVDPEDPECGTAVATDTQRLAELVLALDDWINRGGFLPKQWRK
jgi:hypothetical protein